MDSIEKSFRKLTKLKENLQDLTEEEAYLLFRSILEGRFSEIRTSAFLTAMRIKGETPEELLGVIKAVKEGMNFPKERKGALDLAPNYDGKNRTLYILPSAIWICSRFGMEFTSHFALRTPTKEGITLYEVVKAIGADLSIEFSDQRDHAPELYRLMPLRREIGFRTLINTVEKFLNPFRTRRIVVSLFHRPYFEKNEELLKLLGFEDYTIVKGLEGGLEPPTDRPVYLKRKGKEIESIDPKDLGLDLPDSVQTDRVLEDSVDLNRMIIDGRERGRFFNWAVYTAGLLLYAGGLVGSVEEGIDKIVASKL